MSDMRYPQVGDHIYVYFQQHGVDGVVRAVDINVEAREHWVLLTETTDEMVALHRAERIQFLNTGRDVPE